MRTRPEEARGSVPRAPLRRPGSDLGGKECDTRWENSTGKPHVGHPWSNIGVRRIGSGIFLYHLVSSCIRRRFRSVSVSCQDLWGTKTSQLEGIEWESTASPGLEDQALGETLSDSRVESSSSDPPRVPFRRSSTVPLWARLCGDGAVGGATAAPHLPALKASAGRLLPQPARRGCSLDVPEWDQGA